MGILNDFLCLMFGHEWRAVERRGRLRWHCSYCDRVRKRRPR